MLVPLAPNIDEENFDYMRRMYREVLPSWLSSPTKYHNYVFAAAFIGITINSRNDPRGEWPYTILFGSLSFLTAALASVWVSSALKVCSEIYDDLCHFEASITLADPLKKGSYQKTINAGAYRKRQFVRISLPITHALSVLAVVLLFISLIFIARIQVPERMALAIEIITSIIGAAVFVLAFLPNMITTRSIRRAKKAMIRSLQAQRAREMDNIRADEA